MNGGRALLVVVDGTPLEEPQARAFWERFSAHMDTNRGDLRGFAEAEGFASVHPTVGPGGPVLLVSRSSPQGPYVHAPLVSSPAGALSKGAAGVPAAGPKPEPRPRSRRRR